MRVTITTSVWADKYRQICAGYSIASLLAPGNLPALAKRHDVTFQIVTARKDVRWLWSHPNVQRLEDFCRLELVLMEDHGVQVDVRSKYDVVTRLQNIAIKSARPDDALVFNYADFVWGDGSLPKAVELLDETDAVLGFCLPIDMEKGGVALEERKAGGLICLTSRDLADLAATHLHQEASYRYWDAPEFTRFPSYLLFRVGDEGTVVRAYHQTALVFRVRKGTQTIDGTLDGNFTADIAARGAVVHADDSDSVMVVSLHDGVSHVHARGGNRKATLQSFIARRAGAAQRGFAATPLRVKRTYEDPALWDEVERQSGELVTSLCN